jgi:NADPH-dependent F420 reductase
MNVAIIGTGNFGGALARLFASKGVKLTIGHRDPDKAAAFAAEIGSHVEAGGVAAAARSADVIVLAVPYASVAEVLREAGPLTGKTVVDVTNPLTADYRGLVVGHTTSAAEEIQKLAPGAHVVKAFNTVFAPLLAENARKAAKLPIQVFVAADDEAAKQTVFKLARTGGFDPVDAGPLSNARFIEPLGELNIHLGLFLGQGTTIAPVWIDTRG